jgi:hypothetical protein
MEQLRTLACTICGGCKLGTQRWFLILEDRWQDKLKILHWDDRLAIRRGIHHVCGAAHLQELVVHWMTTGSLDYPFALTVSRPESPAARPSPEWPARRVSEDGRVRPIGELSIHRDSMRRVLSENPESLRSILDALLSALERDAPRSRTEPPREEEPLQEASQ